MSTKEYFQEYYQAHKGDYQQRYRDWYKKHGRAYYAKKRRENPARFQARVDRTNAKYPERTRARVMLKTAVYDGRISKPTECSACHVEQEKRLLHGHHPDWSKPLEVIWLCAHCHKKLH